MQFQKATRVHAKIKMALQGPSGSGKTYSALLLAYGICGDWNKIAVIDTENASANLYAELGQYNVLAVSAPYTPEKFIEAISFCEKSQIQVIIIDSLSHEWEGAGGILDIHSRTTGNSFTAWGKLTPRHNALIECILQSQTHIVATLRTKQDYVLTDKNGKQVPEKVGLRSIQRDGTDYEFTLVFDIDISHQARASKDRTSLFIDKPSHTLSADTGRAIANWCQQGSEAPVKAADTASIKDKIDACNSVEELLQLFTTYPSEQKQHLEDFTRKRKELEQSKPSSQTSKHHHNGTK